MRPTADTIQREYLQNTVKAKASGNDKGVVIEKEEMNQTTEEQTIH